MSKHILRLGFIVIACFLLSGCPFPTSNMSLINNYQQYKNVKLPFRGKKGRAVVYIVQPYFYVDWYMIAGATSDGYSYRGSQLLIQKAGQPLKYVDKITSSQKSICFYVSPGQYVLQFTNEGADPVQLSRTVTLGGKSIHYFALTSKSLTHTRPTLSFNAIDEGRGKYYLQKSLPAHCMDIS